MSQTKKCESWRILFIIHTPLRYLLDISIAFVCNQVPRAGGIHKIRQRWKGGYQKLVKIHFKIYWWKGVKNFWHVDVVSKPQKKYRSHLWRTTTLECTWKSKGQAAPLRGQTNATHWTNWKGVGNRVARFAESPVVRMKRLLTLNSGAVHSGLAQPWGQGGISPPDFGRSVNPIPTRGPYFHTFRRLCVLFWIGMHNQMEFCIDIMLIVPDPGQRLAWLFEKGPVL